MRKDCFVLLAGLAWLLAPSCQHRHPAGHAADSHDHTSEHIERHAESHEGHNHEGHDHESEAAGATHKEGSEIILEPETAERFGVETLVVESGDFNDVIRVAGRILDNPSTLFTIPATKSGVLIYESGVQEGYHVEKGAVLARITADGVAGGDPAKSDQAAYQAALREYERLKPLHEEGLVSTKDYNAALEQYRLAEARYSAQASGGRVSAPRKGVVTRLLAGNGQYVQTGDPIALLSQSEFLTLRADVPDKYHHRLASIVSARMSLPCCGETIDLERVSGSRVDAETPSSRLREGYLPVYFSFKNQGQVVSNTFADVYLIGAVRHQVLSVPKEALVEQQGNYFVYVRIDEEGYEKTRVLTGADDGCRVEILSGLQPGAEVVVKGATVVRLAENSSVVPEGHSHSH